MRPNVRLGQKANTLRWQMFYALPPKSGVRACRIALMMPAPPLPCYGRSNEPRTLDRAIDFLQQLPAKVMIVDFDHMAQSLVEPPVRRVDLYLYAIMNIIRPAQNSVDLQRRDTGLMIGQPPDAADRLE